MGKHDWFGLFTCNAGTYSVCRQCGIPKLQPVMDLPCPPWSSASDGDTKTNRACEAGPIKDLKYIETQAIKIRRLLRKEKVEVDSINKAFSIALGLTIFLGDLIQKHEAKEAEGQK